MQLLILLLLIFTLTPHPTLSGSGGGIVAVAWPPTLANRQRTHRHCHYSHLSVSTAPSSRHPRRPHRRVGQESEGKGLKGQQQPPLNPLGYFSLSRILLSTRQTGKWQSPMKVNNVVPSFDPNSFPPSLPHLIILLIGIRSLMIACLHV